MRFLSKNTGYTANIERYDLCDIASGSAEDKGLVICYTLATCESVQLASLELLAQPDEIGVPEAWHKKYSAASFASSFESLSSFLKTFGTEDFGRWTATIQYQNTEFVFSGDRAATEIGVSYPKDQNIDLVPLLTEVEAQTHRMQRTEGPLARRVKSLIRNSSRWLAAAVFLLGPFVCLFMVETLNESYVFSNLTPLQAVLNLTWYLALFLVVRAVTGLTRGAAAISTGLCFILGLIDHYMLRFRGRALWPADLTAWRTALNVAGSQDLSLDIFMALAAILLAAYLFLLLICPKKPKSKRPGWKSRVISLAAVAVYVAVFFGTNAMPALGLYAHQWETRLNGFALNFTLAAKSMVFPAPEGYSEERLLELAAAYPGTDGDAAQQPENIIIIMNESFADFSIYEKFESDIDPLPFYHSLQGADNTITGTLWSPVWSGGTATVEHEFLTGFSSIFLPYSTVAYLLYMHDDTPSLAEAANAAGYETVAFHPYLSSGWNRVQVYDYMGFDRQLYLDDVEDPQYMRDYISDACDYGVLQSLTEERDGKLFALNITMQNHNGYAQEWTNLEQTVHLSEELTALEPEAEQYFSSLYESDRALEGLIEYYQECEEPTLIVFFGDHQPPLSSEFYEYLAGAPLDDISPELQEKLYQTPFLIWANYEIDADTGVNVTTTGLGVLTAELAGLPLTGLQQFLIDFQEQIPIIFPAGLITDNGVLVTNTEDLDAEARQFFLDYEMLTWCGLMDQFPGMESMYHPSGGA